MEYANIISANAINRAEGGCDQFTARLLAEGDVHAADDNGQCGQGADQDGVYEYLEDTENPLLYRTFTVCGCVRDRRGTQPGLVGESRSSQTPYDRVLEQDTAACTDHGLRIEGCDEDLTEAFTDHADVAEDNDQCKYNVENTQNRR